MAIYDFFLSRNNGPTAETYIGNTGRLFYDSSDGLFRLSDGVTPGGTIVANLALAKISETAPANPQQGELWLNPSTSELWAYNQGTFIPTINIATETKIGGIKLGPGVITNSEGQLIIDTAGLEFSFGDFGSIIGEYTDETPYALLQTVNLNEDAVIASNGTGKVAIVGEFTVHATNGSVTGSLETDSIFKISSDGQVRILVPDTDTNAGAIEIIGSSTGDFVTPGQPGTMLHITGQQDEQARIYIDGNGNYASIVGRRWNGTISGGRTQVLANEDVLRINATAQTNTELPNQSIAQIAFTSLENQTATSQGSEITFVVTPIGQPTANRVSGLKVKSNGIELPTPGTSIKFFGATSGTIDLKSNDIAGTNTITLPASTGTVMTTAGTNTVTGVLAGTISINPTSITRSTESIQTFTLTGLTTNHKIIITSGTALGYGVFISAAWASSLNTLSIEFQNFTGNQDIDLPAKTIQYFAWL